MANKKRVFISFDVDNDQDIKVLLAGQAELGESPFEFVDASVKGHLAGDWKGKVKRRLANVEVVIILCGEKTHTASGVAAELSIAKDIKTPYFLLSAYPNKNCMKPTSATAGDKLYEWTWPNLKLLINGSR